MQRDANRPGIDQQRIGKRRGAPGVVAKRLDESPPLLYKRLDECQLMHAINGYPMLGGHHQAEGFDVGADPNLSHRADRILSQGWKPVLN